jgi:hypothetical protein
VFVQSLSPSAKANSYKFVIDLNKINPGEVRLVRTEISIYVVAQSEEILRDLEILSNHVWNNEITTKFKSRNGRVYYIFSSRGTIGPGCFVKHYPKLESNIHATPEVKWNGGFLDLCRDVSYDYAGRLIQDISYSYINFSRRGQNLKPIAKLFEEEQGILVYYGEQR